MAGALREEWGELWPGKPLCFWVKVNKLRIARRIRPRDYEKINIIRREVELCQKLQKLLPNKR